MPKTFTYQCGGTTFVPAPDLQLAYANAELMVRRCCRSHIESADLFMGMYYGADSDTSDLLKMAIPVQRFDAAMLEKWSNPMRNCAPNGSFGASALAVLAVMAELAMFYRGPIDRDIGLITVDELALALINDGAILQALREAGVLPFHLRHLEGALRLRLRQQLPIVIDSDAAIQDAQNQIRAH